MPTRTLIGLAVAGPGATLEFDARSELRDRLRAGAVGTASQQELLDALVPRLDSAHHLMVDELGVLMSDLADAPNADRAALDGIVSFLMRRHEDQSQPWYGGWSATLRKLHASGVLSEEQHGEVLAGVCRPEFWRNGTGAVRPGEHFMLGIDFPRGQYGLDGTHVLEVRYPEGVVREPTRFGARWEMSVASTGLPRPTSVGLWAPFVAPAEPGTYEFVVRVWFTEVNENPAVFRQQKESEIYDTRVVESRLTLAVEGHPIGESDVDSIEEYLQRRLFVHRGGGGGRFRWYRDFSVGLAVFTGGGGLSADGSIVVVRPDGSRAIQGRFWTSPDESGFRDTRGGGSSSSSGPLGDVAGIGIQIDSQFAHPTSGARLFLHFNEVSLPDGRKHEGPEPIEIEIHAGHFFRGLDW